MDRRRVVLGFLGVGAVAGGTGAIALASRHETEPYEHLLARIAAASRRTFSPAELRADLAYLCDALVDICVEPFQHSAKASFAAMRRSIEAHISVPLDKFGFGLRVAPLFASLLDGHIAIGCSDMMYQFERDGGGVFPLRLTFAGDAAYVTRSRAFGVPDGSRLLAIDGVSASRIAANVLGCTSAPTPQARAQFASDVSATSMWLRAILGPRPSFSVAYESEGVRFERRVSARKFDEVAKLTASTTGPPVAFRMLAEGAVGYLDYRRCESGPVLDRALHDAFARAKAANVRALVVDVRNNGGGSTSSNDRVLNYLTAKPYSQGNRFSVRASRMVKARYGFVGFLRRYYAPAAWFAPEGSVVTVEVPDIFARTQPGANPLRFAGPVYLLVGPATFSSAMSFAQTVSDFGIATLVGEPLGEPANSNGEVFSVRAPRTCLNAGIASKFYYATKPRPNDAVITPDIVVKTTVNDVRLGRDPVLDAVLRHIGHA